MDYFARITAKTVLGVGFLRWSRLGSRLPVRSLSLSLSRLLCIADEAGDFGRWREHKGQENLAS